MMEAIVTIGLEINGNFFKDHAKVNTTCLIYSR